MIGGRGPLVPTVYPQTRVRSSRNTSHIRDGLSPPFVSPPLFDPSSLLVVSQTKGRGHSGQKRKEKQDAQRAGVFAFFPDVAQAPKKGPDVNTEFAE